jgi:hypothetical protein
MRQQRGCGLGLRGAIVVILANSGAVAQLPEVPRSTSSIAEALFREGKELMDAGQTSQACAKFAESQRLEAALGTLLNLAVCHERDGKTASAWSAFSDAQTMAERAGDDERAEFARSQFERLRSAVPRLVIRVTEQTPEPEVLVDGSMLGQAAWGTEVPLDPGVHRVQARAPGRKTWLASPSLVDGGKATVLEVPPLTLEGPPAAPVVKPTAEKAHDARVAGVGLESSRANNLRRTGAIIGGGIALAGLAVGSYWGLRALSKQRIVEANCEHRECRNQTGLDADHDAHEASSWSDAGFGLGLVAATVSVYLLVTSRATPSHTSASFNRSGLSVATGPGTLGIGARLGF